MAAGDARRAGQGPRPLRRRRGPAAAGCDRPDQRVRRDLAHADPRQGPGADRVLRVLVQAVGVRGAEPPDFRRAGRVPAAVRRRQRAGGPGHTRARGRRDPDGVRGPRLPRRLRLDAVPGATGRSAASGSRWVCGIGEAARADLHARRPRRPRGTTCRSRPPRPRELVGVGLYERLREASITLYQRIAQRRSAPA